MNDNQKDIKTPVAFDESDASWYDVDGHYLGHFEPCGESGESDLARCHAIANAINSHDALVAENERLTKAINDEPDLPGGMPDEMWQVIHNDRDAMQELLRITVRLTKDGIKRRAALEPVTHKEEKTDASL